MLVRAADSDIGSTRMSSLSSNGWCWWSFQSALLTVLCDSACSAFPAACVGLASNAANRYAPLCEMERFWTGKRVFGATLLLVAALLIAACASDEGSHTTATTYVAPPPRQVISVVSVPSTYDVKRRPEAKPPNADPTEPLLQLYLPRANERYRVGDVVVVDFSVSNAKLKGNGGDFRIRYFVDDDDARWLDDPTPFGLTGWIPGKHTLRMELIGPDGWPYRNGDQNIVTREINITSN